ncbi:hypothetical protein ACL7TT_13150 [Microbulbifer sp. 2304DJ12-6]|uniref:hypothetical protein n=1 Tax=Microbulbifer sp. 2304DJ12-6 TaxID=3233340 RepID=UPI0039AFEDDC
MKTRFLFSVCMLIAALNSRADKAITFCEIISDGVCSITWMRTPAEKIVDYYSIHRMDYSGYSFVWRSEIENAEIQYKWVDNQEGDSIFYAFPKGTPGLEIKSVDTNSAVYVYLSNEFASMSVREFISIYELMQSGRKSKYEFKKVFSGLNFLEKIYYNFNEFRESYLGLDGSDLKLTAIRFGSPLECQDCLYLTFEGPKGNWRLWGKLGKGGYFSIQGISQFE